MKNIPFKIIGFSIAGFISIMLITMLLGVVLWVGFLFIQMFDGPVCFNRYNPANFTTNDTVQVFRDHKIFSLKANGNYNFLENENTTENTLELTPDPDGYYKWYNTGVRVGEMDPNLDHEKNKIKIFVEGRISLCRAKAAADNSKIINDFNDEAYSQFVLSAANLNPYIISKVYKNDKIDAFISKPYSGNVSLTDIYGVTHNANCDNGRKIYDPVCSFYSPSIVTNYQRYQPNDFGVDNNLIEDMHPDYRGNFYLNGSLADNNLLSNKVKPQTHYISRLRGKGQKGVASYVHDPKVFARDYNNSANIRVYIENNITNYDKQVWFEPWSDDGHRGSAEGEWICWRRNANTVREANSSDSWLCNLVGQAYNAHYNNTKQQHYCIDTDVLDLDHNPPVCWYDVEKVESHQGPYLLAYLDATMQYAEILNPEYADNSLRGVNKFTAPYNFGGVETFTYAGNKVDLYFRNMGTYKRYVYYEDEKDLGAPNYNSLYRPNNNVGIDYFQTWYGSGAALYYQFEENNNYNFDNSVLNNVSSNYTDTSKTMYSPVINGAEDHILNIASFTGQPAYLKMRFYNRSGYQTSGGYILNIKQESCVRENGDFDVNSLMFANQGKIEMKVISDDEIPNKTELENDKYNNWVENKGAAWSYSKSSDYIMLSSPPKKGTLWMRIKNHNGVTTYDTSTGQYSWSNSSVNYAEESKGAYRIRIQKVGLTQNEVKSIISEDIVDRLVNFLNKGSKLLMQKVTCYNMENNENCFAFFSYIKALLILFILYRAFMYLMGATNINQTELVIDMVKFGLIVGLMNGKTYEFFIEYIFPLITDTMGYLIDSISNAMRPPEDDAEPGETTGRLYIYQAVVAEIFGSESFIYRALALAFFFPFGSLIFLLLIVATISLFIALFRSLGIYLMAHVALAILIGLSPVFLTFLLFQQTRYLFDNWVKFIIRYTLEPVILMMGLTIIVQLILIYYDKVLGFSVCYKCAIPFSLPLESASFGLFKDLQIFCIPFFLPWGYDLYQENPAYSVGIIDLIMIIILVQILRNFINFVEEIVDSLSDFSGGPSVASQGAAAMDGAASYAGTKAADKLTGTTKVQRQAMANKIKGRGSKAINNYIGKKTNSNATDVSGAIKKLKK